MRSILKLNILVVLAGLLAFGCDDNGTTETDGGMSDTDGGMSDSDGGMMMMNCPAEGVQISGEISEDTHWTCPVYELEGNVFVTNNAVLTIDAGATIYGKTGGASAASLVVTRGAQIMAEGTAAAPIVFTSGNPDGARATGDWAGVALLGSATTNDGECEGGSGDACTGGFLQDRIEGIPVSNDHGIYGGTDDASSCGTLRYVRIEFAGRELSPDNELNGLTLGGCGAGTVLSHVQVHRGKDDGIEFFGGTASLDHIVISGASDDSLDFDEGWRGNGQFIVIHQLDGVGDRGIEADNYGSNELAEPTTRPSLFNVTMIGNGSTQVALMREGMQGIFGNFLITNFGKALDVQASVADPNAAWTANNFRIMNSHFHGTGDFAAEDLSIADFWAMADDMAGGALADTPPANLKAVVNAIDDAEDAGTITEVQAEAISSLLKERLDDDMGFNEMTQLMSAGCAFEAGDPGLTISDTAPGYMPPAALSTSGMAPQFNSFAPSGFGDTAATYVGAFEPGGTDWSAGWTAFPAD